MAIASSVLKTLAECSVDSVVTDPPYGIGFMGKAWDGADISARAEKRRQHPSQDPTARSPNGGHKSAAAAAAGRYNLTTVGMLAFQEFSAEWAGEVLRVLKPGGYLLSFASARTYHRMVCGIEDAGFEIRDCIQWIFGSGFPKSKNLDGDWQGWGTALKPAHEPICVARRPLVGTVAANVLQFGTGALNIDGCRVGGDGGKKWETPRGGIWSSDSTAQSALVDNPLGRWPANVIHDGSDEVVALFPQAPGQLCGVGPQHGEKASINTFGDYGPREQFNPRGDTGSAARFFYCSKASRADRNEGCEAMERKPLHWSSGDKNPGSFQGEGTDKTSQNNHPTVKPTNLMRYLCRLVTPPGGIVLDPFMGSGSTGKAAILEGFKFIGIEREADYISIATARIDAARLQYADEHRQMGLEPGELALIEAKMPRSGKFHRYHMALEQRLFDAQERFGNFEMMRYWIKVGAGWVTWAAGPKGGVVPIPKSISFAKADEEEFRKYHDLVIDFLRGEHASKYLWPHLPESERAEMMSGILTEFEG